MDLCPNVYGDTTWSPGYLLKDFVKKNGNRLMLGSDHANNLPVELAKIENSSFTEQEKRYILSDTAIAVFSLDTERK